VGKNAAGAACPSHLGDEPVDKERLDARRRRAHFVDRHRVVGDTLDQHRQCRCRMGNGNLMSQAAGMVQSNGQIKIATQEFSKGFTGE